MNKKIKLLITSVGSLVSQNILDVLEYPLFRRRELVEIIGTNSLALNSNNFRCDKCYLVPDTSTENFKNILSKILIENNPDIILNGRDEDTVVVGEILDILPELKSKHPYGSIKTLIYALDKWQSWEFSKKYNLPFAETFMFGKSGELNELKIFVERLGYPLIAKPVRGFASKGVFFIRNWKDVITASRFENYIFQEYLGNADINNEYFNMIDSLTPLFAHAPNIYHYTCHTFIKPNGEIMPPFISHNQHQSGATVGFRKIENEELNEIIINFANAIKMEGGAGPFGVQFRKDKNGEWKAQEMNMRPNGNTFPRFMLGQDDLALIFNSYLPEFNFPEYIVPTEIKQNIITKSLYANRVSKIDLENLEKSGYWIKS